MQRPSDSDRAALGARNRPRPADGSMAMVIEILRELGREVLAESAAQESSAVHKPFTDSSVSGKQQSESSLP